MILSIEHEEYEGQGTYDGVTLSHDEGIEIFNTGDVLEDFNNALKWARDHQELNNDGLGMIMCSSSVDHFLSEDPQSYDMDDEIGLIRV